MFENTAGSSVLEHALSALSAVFCVMAPVPGGPPTTTTRNPPTGRPLVFGVKSKSKSKNH